MIKSRWVSILFGFMALSSLALGVANLIVKDNVASLGVGLFAAVVATDMAIRLWNGRLS